MNRHTNYSPQQIRSWINRQRTLSNPSYLYIEWLRKQFKINCIAEKITGGDQLTQGERSSDTAHQ